MRRILLCALLPLLALAAAAQAGLSEWYSSSPAARRYKPMEAELAALMAEAESRGIPSELILSRLAEGAEKRVAPERLAAALRGDIEAYASVLAILAESAPGAASGPLRASLLGRGGMVLRAGLPGELFKAVLGQAVAKGIEPGRAIDALLAVAAAGSRLGLDAGSQESLALSLALSKEKSERFSLLSSLFLRGQAGKMGPRELVSLAISVFDSGGGFLQLEGEITRRLK